MFTMKTILLACLLIPVMSFAQKITEDKIDEFTKSSVKRTSWDKLFSTMKATSHIRVSKINGIVYLNLKLMDGSVFSMDENAKLMLKSTSDSIVTLYNLKFQITCRGCGAPGFGGSAAEGIDVSYVIDQDQAEYLKTHPLNKVRIYTSEGYIEEQVKSKNSDLLSSQLKLVL